jgi:hypothetical protein
MYTGGDVCDDTRLNRETKVTFKCLENVVGFSSNEIRYQYDEATLCKRMFYYNMPSYNI